MLFEKVLLATDYSRPSEQLFHCLPELNNFGLKEVILAHVADTHSAGGNVVEFQKHNEKRLEPYKKKLEEMGLKVTVKVPIGFISEEINNLAEEEKASLILVGSHGKGIIKQRFLGSTTTNILRKTTTPVLVEKFKNLGTDECEAFCKQKFLRMLIPTDFSTHSMRMIEEIKKAENIKDLVLLSVLEQSESHEDVQEHKSILETKLKLCKVSFKNWALQSPSRFVKELLQRISLKLQAMKMPLSLQCRKKVPEA